jgi:hypothetical protein
LRRTVFDLAWGAEAPVNANYEKRDYNSDQQQYGYERGH